MATTTANLRLTKPLGAERYDINVFNNNADLIDAGFHAANGHDHSGRAGEGPQLTDAALAAGAVTTAKLALDTFHAEQFRNALPNGGFESWSGGGTSAPDGWSLSGANAQTARATSVVKHGRHAASLKRRGADCDLRRGLVDDLGGLTYLRGRTFTLGGWVYATVPNRARLELGDGVTTSISAYHTGGSAWEWLTVTIAVDSAAPTLLALCKLKQGDTTAWFDGLQLAEGTLAHAFTPHPLDEALRLTNFQDSTPANHVDRGQWRAEVGVASVAGVRSQNWSDHSVSFETSFRTVYAALATPREDIGGRRIVARCTNLRVDGFTLQAATGDGRDFSSTDPGLVYWLAIGAV
ncbi:MAG: hypothetical protein OXG17_01935 [Chloroflexi bacterium]|nr:hypothetical protein [Chloroflexota bacterium]